MTDSASIQKLLDQLREGDTDAAQELLQKTHAELHRVARMIMRDQRPSHTLQATALVNEAFLRIVEVGEMEVDDLGHWVRMATKTMRTALIDHERARAAKKRGGDMLRMSLHDGSLSPGGVAGGRNLLDVDAALKKLEELDPDLGRLVEMRFFGGLEMEEVAALMGIPKRTCERRWQAARMWLLNELKNR